MDNQRHQIILNELDKKGNVTVASLVELTGASESSIRRDLVELDHQGFLKRVHGGATLIPKVTHTIEDPLGKRQLLNADEKKKIAKYAAGMIEALKTKYFAKLNNVPTSPRKMRLVADMVRGMEAFKALGVLKFSSKEASARLEKLLRSAIANWEQKNERKAESGELYISEIYVNSAAMLKRLRPAPQGRGYRIRKRSNHVTLFVDTISSNKPENQD